MTTRSTTPRGSATRARIVDAAAVLFHEHGVEATGLDDVLAASGTGKSQLYHYFGGKAGLVDDVIDTQAARIVAWHTERLAAVDDVAGLRRWADDLVATVAEQRGAFGCPLGSLAAELADRSPEHRARVAAGFGRWEDVLAQAVARVLGDADRAAGPAAALLAAVQGGLLLADATGDTRFLRAGLDTAVMQVGQVTPARGKRRPHRGSSR